MLLAALLACVTSPTPQKCAGFLLPTVRADGMPAADAGVVLQGLGRDLPVGWTVAGGSVNADGEVVAIVCRAAPSAP